MKFNKKFFKNWESGKWKRPNDKTSKEKDKGFSKGKKVECFNYGGLRHFAIDSSRPKDIKDSIQATWSDTDYEESGSRTSEDAWYDHTGFLAFVAFVESVLDSDYDRYSENECTNDKKKLIFWIIL